MSEKYLGESIKKLGFGLMRLPMAGEKIDTEQVKKMVDVFMENGCTYFDTAYFYLDGHSEPAAKEVLVDRYPRESYQLATKLPCWCMKSSEDCKRIFEDQLQKTGAGYFDYYLLHAVDREKILDYEKFGAWEFVKEQKEAGKIKHYGFSFHDTADVLDDILKKHPDTEFVQLQINYIDWEDSIVQAKQCYDVARKHNKPVLIMEPVRGGRLVELPEELESIFKEVNPQLSAASWAIRFAASLEGVITVLSGMSNMKQMEDNLSYMKEFQPLSETEEEAITKVAAGLRNMPVIGCTNCQYCVEGCPQSINIPGIFREYNGYMVFKDMKAAKGGYEGTVNGKGKASDCVECGSCEGSCPQHIQIIKELRKAAELFCE